MYIYSSSLCVFLDMYTYLRAPKTIHNVQNRGFIQQQMEI